MSSSSLQKIDLSWRLVFISGIRSILGFCVTGYDNFSFTFWNHIRHVPCFQNSIGYFFWFLKIQYKIEHQLSNFFKRVRLDFDENNVMSVDELRKLSNCQSCLLILGSAIFQFNYYFSEHVLWFKTIFLIFWFYLFCFWDRVTPCSQADLKLLTLLQSQVLRLQACSTTSEPN